MLTTLLLSTGALLSSGHAAVAAPPLAPAAFDLLVVVQDDEATIRDLITRGRELLRAGKAIEAETAFTQADELAGGKQLPTYVWVLRSWVAQGRYNDAFNEIDAFAEPGGSPIEVHYILGMGSYQRALANAAAGGTSTLQLAWMDTVQKLTKVVDEDAARFDDAWQPLAHAAIEGNDTAHLELALRASEQAVAVEPKSGAALEVRGRAFFWNYRELSSAGKEAEATEALEQAIRAWRAAIDVTPAERANANLLANIHLRAAVGELWRQDKTTAARHYGEAIGWWPSMVNYQDLWSSLTTADGENPIQPYIDCLQTGRRLFGERWGDDPADATMLWWLGYGQMRAQKYEDSEATFLDSVRKNAAFTNNYWYIGLCRYYREDYPGAAEFWRKQFDANPADSTSSITSDAAANVPIVAYTQGKRAELGERNHPAMRDAAALGEMLVRAEPGNWQRWNDLGLFSRDAGASMPDSEKGAARKRAQLWMRGVEAYETAIRLSPEMPHLYNDAAVILHYYLDRDFDRAEELYNTALEMATQQLEAGTLEGEPKRLAEIAKRDAANNLRALAAKRDGDEGGGH